MERKSFALTAAILLGLVAGCGGGHGPSAPDVLDPPADSGLVAADLDGSWRITEVDPRLWITLRGDTDASPPPTTRGLMPPVVGAQITIVDGEFTDGNGLALRREAFDRWTIITSYLNLVGERVGLYTMRRHAHPEMPDGGSATLQMAVGTVDRDHLLGVIYHKVSAMFVRAGEPVELMANLRLERVR